MCVPSTVMTGISVLGSALGMADSLAGQRRQAEEARQAQALAVQNAETARQNARQALSDGEKEKEKIRLEQKALQSQKAVQYGAGNVSLAGGSPLNVLADMAQKGEYEAQEAGEAARRRAEQYERQAQNFLGQDFYVSPFGTAEKVLSGISSAADGFSALQGKAQNSAKTTFAGRSAQSPRRGPNYF